MSQSLKEDHFEDNDPASKLLASMRNPDQQIDENEVDEDMFVFPDRNGGAGSGDQPNEEESKQAPVGTPPMDNNQLADTQELIHRVNDRQQ